MKYKELYVELAEFLTRLGCSVCDHDLMGYCYQTAKIRAFIIIKPDMTYKEKYLTLCHEAGHLFLYKNNQKFVWSKTPMSELSANHFALQLLASHDIDEKNIMNFTRKLKRKLRNVKSLGLKFNLTF